MLMSLRLLSSFVLTDRTVRSKMYLNKQRKNIISVCCSFYRNTGKCSKFSKSIAIFPMNNQNMELNAYID